MYSKVRASNALGNFFRNVTVQDRVSSNKVEIGPGKRGSGVALLAGAFVVGSTLVERFDANCRTG
jgi:hypothetical protein